MWLSGHHTLALPVRGLDRPREQDTKPTSQARQPYIYVDSNWLQTDVPRLDWKEYHQRVQEALVVSLAHKRALNAVYNSLIPLDVRFGENYQLWRFNLHLPKKKAALEAIFAAGLVCQFSLRLVGRYHGQRRRQECRAIGGERHKPLQ